MSVNSSWSYECRVPKGTKLNHESCDYPYVRDKGDHFEVSFEDGDGGYAEDILEDLVTLFGMPLDEVPGLELHAWYRYEEDDHDEVTVDIRDGKVECEETVKKWRPCTLEETGIGIGRREQA